MTEIGLEWRIWTGLLLYAIVPFVSAVAGCLGAGRGRAILATLAFAASLLAVSFLRVGTDLTMYEGIARAALDGTDSPLRGSPEVGFKGMVSLTAVTGSEIAAVRLLASLQVLAWAVLWWASDDVGRVFLSGFYVPAFGWGYSLNALRAGWGLVFALFAWQALRRGRVVPMLVFSLLGATMHLSAVLVLFLVLGPLIFDRRVDLPPAWLASGAVGAVWLVFNALPWVREKVWLYSQLGSAGPGSGSLTAGVALGGAMLAWAGTKRAGIRLAATGVIACTCASVLTAWLFSYSGLRVVGLLALAGGVLCAEAWSSREGQMKRRARVLISGLGLAALLGVLWNVVADVEGARSGTETPFLPLRTIFDGS